MESFCCHSQSSYCSFASLTNRKELHALLNYLLIFQTKAPLPLSTVLSPLYSLQFVSFSFSSSITQAVFYLIIYSRQLLSASSFTFLLKLQSQRFHIQVNIWISLLPDTKEKGQAATLFFLIFLHLLLEPQFPETFCFYTTKSLLSPISRGPKKSE